MKFDGQGATKVLKQLTERAIKKAWVSFVSELNK